MSEITEKAKLGQQISFTGTLRRHQYGIERKWVTDTHEPKSGIIVQAATLWDGRAETEYGDGDAYYTWFVQGDHFRALLVAFDLNRKPVWVPLSHITAA